MIMLLRGAGCRMRGSLVSFNGRPPPFASSASAGPSTAVSHRRTRFQGLVCHANNEGNDGNRPQPSTSGGVPAVLLLFVGSAAYTLTVMRDEVSDFVYNDDTLGDWSVLGLGFGDFAGAALWAAALWYASPLQLLLAFLGKFDRERPSDWIMNKLGRAAGLPVDAVEYAAPAWLQAVAALTCFVGGISISALLASGLGDPTWSISSGIGALFAAAIFEVGRPARLTVQEAQQLEMQWQDFASWADKRLDRSGRCHESEVMLAFRRAHARYRSADVISDSVIRDMVKNWHPGVERTRSGYLKGLSVRTAAPVPSALMAASSRGSTTPPKAGGPDQQTAGQAATEGSTSLLDQLTSQQVVSDAEQQQGQQQQHQEQKQPIVVSKNTATNQPILKQRQQQQ